MNRDANIVLVGFMGTGKTSVGKKLAEQLGRKFLDMDDVIEEREGKPIPRIFAECGEARFRELERAMVRELAADSGLVIAAGGGIVLNSANIVDYSRTGCVVCLSARPDVILDRVKRETHRPLLAGEDKMKRIESILRTRKILYDAIPLQVDTSDLTLGQVVEHVLSLCHPVGDPV